MGKVYIDHIVQKVYIIVLGRCEKKCIIENLTGFLDTLTLTVCFFLSERLHVICCFLY